MTKELYDIVIIGGGPAGVAAGVYAARKQMKAVLVTDTFGGQSIVSATVENWIGDVSIKGIDLAQKLEAHVRAQENLEIQHPKRVQTVEKNENATFNVTLDDGTQYNTKTILIVTGGRHRHLNVPGEEKFKGRGVVYCSTCDAPMFRDKDVAVIGVGNSGLEAVEDLLPYAKHITLVSIDDQITGDPITFEKIKTSPKVDVLYNANTTEVQGEVMVTGMKYTDTQTDKEKEIKLQGVFVEVGVVPNTELVKNLLDLTDYGHIKIDHKDGATSVPGIFAAGDVTEQLYRQNNIAAGDAIKATLAAYDYAKKETL